MRFFKPSVFLLLLCCILLGCNRSPKSTAEVPTVLSHAYSVSVAPFTQPRVPSDLIMGNLPEPQGLIEDKDLLLLDSALKHVLTDKAKARTFVFLTDPLEGHGTQLHVGSQPEALSKWLAYGKAHKADLLLVPQVLDWHEREGSRAGVTASAHVRIAFYLLNISHGTVMNRSIFEEKQAALTENFLTIGSFLKRRGQWVQATDLAIEGMHKAKNEFGL